MKIPFEWENIYEKTINSTHFAFTGRAKVLGGWIINNRTCAGSRGHESMVFIPDEKHEWELEIK